MLRLAIVLSLITHIAACGKDDGTSRTYTSNNPNNDKPPTTAPSTGTGKGTTTSPTPTKTGDAAKPTFEFAPEKPDLVALKAEFLTDAERFKKKPTTAIINSLTSLSLSANLGAGILGLCQIDSAAQKRTVQILAPKGWPGEKPSVKQFKMTVYHELGHCFLEYGHTPDQKMAIMAAFSFPNADVEAADWEALLKDLYSGARAEKIGDQINLIGGGVVNFYDRQ